MFMVSRANTFDHTALPIITNMSVYLIFRLDPT